MSNGVTSIEQYPPLQTGMVAIAPDGTTTYVYQPPGLVPPIAPPPDTIDGYPSFDTMGVGIDPDGVVWQYAPTQPGGIVEVTPPPAPPVNVTPPTIQIVSGNPVPGQTAVNSNPGTWNPPAVPANNIQRQWYLSGTPIAGATGTSYIVQEGDVGGGLQCGTRATGDGGQSVATAMSNTLNIIAAPPEDELARLDDNGGAPARHPAPRTRAKAKPTRKR